MTKIYVTGHQNPDTDSIISSLGFSYYLNEIWKNAKAIKLWPLNNESKFVLDYANINKPEKITKLEKWANVFLVDHNEKKQSIQNLDELNLIWILDHHNLWQVSTSKPIFMRVEPLWCSASIIYKVFKENNVEIPKQIAQLLVSWILSDTLFFRSPTTTEEDKKILSSLNNIAEIQDLEKYSLDMFNAKSDLWNIDAKELVELDFKIYQMWNKNIWYWVMETTNPDYALNRKNEILEAMEYIKNEKELDFLFFSVIDILNQKNITFVLDEDSEKIIQTVFKWDIIENHLIDLGDRISRKKKIIPFLIEFFEK